jgi:restriction system-associated AAA family ATPase
MKILRVHIISAETCGGLLDGLNVKLRSSFLDYNSFDPLCLIGPNGAGKSQFLQMIAKIFQSVFHTCLKSEERDEGNPGLQFEIEYLISSDNDQSPIRVLISRKATRKKQKNFPLLIQKRDDYDWVDCDPNSSETHALLPQKIIGYTSGDNETLSLPFLVSRSGYATEVRERALNAATRNQSIPDTRLMLIDYGTHLEVLVANLLLGKDSQREALLSEAKLQDLHSFRCIIQLAHSAAPKAQGKIGQQTRRKGIQLTEELETYIEQLQRCATCHTYDEKTETYIFDYWINDQTRNAFRSFWDNALNLYSSFHKLAMLNDLALPRESRRRFQSDTKTRRFASRLPEPQDEDKVFRFERVRFRKQKAGEDINNQEVDYVSLSDGEHQLGQVLGLCCMKAAKAKPSFIHP